MRNPVVSSPLRTIIDVQLRFRKRYVSFERCGPARPLYDGRQPELGTCSSKGHHIHRVCSGFFLASHPRIEFSPQEMPDACETSPGHVESCREGMESMSEQNESSQSVVACPFGPLWHLVFPRRLAPTRTRGFR
jgi:hypothetical protein